MFELAEIAEWINFDYGNWTIKDDAPEKAKEMFFSWAKQYEKHLSEGIICE